MCSSGGGPSQSRYQVQTSQYGLDARARANPCRTEANPGSPTGHGRQDRRRSTAGLVAREGGGEDTRPLQPLCPGRVGRGLKSFRPPLGGQPNKSIAGGGHGLINKEAKMARRHVQCWPQDVSPNYQGVQRRETSCRLGMRSGQPRDKQPGECALDRGFSVGHKRCCMSTCFILDKRPVERGWRKPLPSRRSNLGASVSKPSIGPPLLAQTGEGRR